MPKKKNTLDKTIEVRLTKPERERIFWLAKTYAGGNMSRWIRYAALSAPRKILK